MKILQITGIFLGIMVCSVIVHKAGHFIGAIIKGVPPASIEIGWYGIGPGVRVPTSFPVEYLPFFRYSGGLTAGLISILLYGLFWIYPFHPKTTKLLWGSVRWWTGEILLLWGIFQIVNGYFEGANFERYIKESAPMELSLIIAIFASFSVHAIITLVRKKRLKENIKA